MKNIVNTIVVLVSFIIIFIGIYVINTTAYYGNIPDAIHYLAKTLEGGTYIMIGGMGLLLELYYYLKKKNTNGKKNK